MSICDCVSEVCFLITGRRLRLDPVNPLLAFTILSFVFPASFLTDRSPFERFDLGLGMVIAFLS